MRPLSRNARRRLALYGTATGIGALVLLGPHLIRRTAPDMAVRRFQTQEAFQSEPARRLTEYLKIDTTNPPGTTDVAAAFWARLFDCEGIDYEIVGIDPKRPIVVARLPGETRQGALLLLHHMDVAPAGDLKAWRSPPFAGELGTGDDYLYLVGRGTLDMKGQGIASFFAMAALKRAGITPRRDIVFVAEPGEESYEPQRGVGWLLANRPDLLSGVTDVFNEGGVNEVLADRIQLFGIEIVQKALGTVFLEAKSEEALRDFRAFLEARDRELPRRVTGPMARFMETIGAFRPEWGNLMLRPEEAFASARFWRDAPDIYQTLLRDRLYAGPVRPTPDGRFAVKAVYSLLPGSPVEANVRQLEGWAASRGITTRRGVVTDDAKATPMEGRAWRSLALVLGLDEERAEVGPYVLAGSYSNSIFLRARGFRAYGVSPFNVNIADAEKIHGLNERINVVYFVEGVERMKRILLEFATAP